MGSDEGMSGCSTSIPIDSSNLGFKLLKKHGWKEGTGLGIAEQGRLEPVPAYIKKNKRGLGAEKPKKAAAHPKSPGHSSDRKILKDGDKESEWQRELLHRSNLHLSYEEYVRKVAHEFHGKEWGEKLMNRGIILEKTKGMSKKMKKVVEFEKRMQEKEFERAFFREFWPDNV